MNELILNDGDRIICNLYDAYECILSRKDEEDVIFPDFKIVSFPDSNSAYIDTRSIVSGSPKVVFNIGSEQSCKIVRWRDSGLDMLSCFHPRRS